MREAAEKSDRQTGYRRITSIAHQTAGVLQLLENGAEESWQQQRVAGARNSTSAASNRVLAAICYTGHRMLD